MIYMEFMQDCFEQWKWKRECNDAIALNTTVGEKYFDTGNPQFFTGDLNADVVLVHLNPYRNERDWYADCNFADYSQYMEFYSRFGNKHYGKDSGRYHKSKFDHKQIRFLKPFGILPLNESDVYDNLENVIDKKLQLELVPFGSPNFDYGKLSSAMLKPYATRILNLIAQRERKYIIFCGRVYVDILQEWIVATKTHRVKLTKKDGSPTKGYYEVINIKLMIDGKQIQACIAPQYATHGLPDGEYGKLIYNKYVTKK